MRTMATPMYDQIRTPMRTPMRDTGTPMHEGMRTPMHDMATPLHDAWNANAPNTPARREEDLSDLSGGASWGWSARTWDAPTPNTATPGTVGTPGTYYETPYFTPGTPSIARTPFASSTPGAQPYTPGAPHTPGAYPRTPGLGDDAPISVAQQAASIAAQAAQPWQTPDIEVTVGSRVGAIKCTLQCVMHSC